MCASLLKTPGNARTVGVGANRTPIRSHAPGPRRAVILGWDSYKIAIDGHDLVGLSPRLFPVTYAAFIMSIEIKIRKNEPIDRALRRMKKKLDRENIIKGTRAKRYYEKPCEKRRRKDKVQAFTQMLRRRYAE